MKCYVPTTQPEDAALTRLIPVCWTTRRRHRGRRGMAFVLQSRSVQAFDDIADEYNEDTTSSTWRWREPFTEQHDVSAELVLRSI